MNVITKFQCRDEDEKDGEPLEKVPRVVLRRLSGLRPGVMFYAPAVHVYQLPDEILVKIFECIEIRHYHNIRATSKRFCHVVNMCVMHKFSIINRDFVRESQHNVFSALMRCIKLDTEAYVLPGYGSTFCGCFLPFLCGIQRDRGYVKRSEIQLFLRHFYQMMHNQMGGPKSQQSCLLYNITLLRILKSYNKVNISFEFTGLVWCVTIECTGPWLGVLWDSRGEARFQPFKWINLLVMMSEMLIGDILQWSFKRMWECSSEIYLFGIDTSGSKRAPRTIFRFSIFGSQKIITLLRSCLESTVDHFQWPTEWPRDQFIIDLSVTSREALKWGCMKYERIQFGPFNEAFIKNYDCDCETFPKP